MNLKNTVCKMLQIIIVPIVFMSCSDVIIIEANDNYACRKELTCFGTDNISDIERTKYYKQVLNKYPISDKNNLKHLKNTKTLILYNNSETKVYEVTIQKKINNSKVLYEDFTIEPTQKICLGCSENFYTDLQEEGVLTRRQKLFVTSGPEVESKYKYYSYEAKVRKKDKIDYKVHRTKAIKEY